jgi:sigma-E factor negative regulatory protein RseC
VGDSVVVSASRDVANKALLLSFGVPFLILVSVLLIMLKLISEEGIAALVSLLALIPYYVALYFLRDRIQQKIAFSIE